MNLPRRGEVYVCDSNSGYYQFCDDNGSYFYVSSRPTHGYTNGKIDFTNGAQGISFKDGVTWHLDVFIKTVKPIKLAEEEVALLILAGVPLNKCQHRR